MEVGDLDSRDDRQAITDIARRSMRASYSLSPEQIDAVVEEAFAPDALAEKGNNDDIILVVAREDGEPVGFAEGTDDATIRWLHVVPESRGQGVGTRLFDTLYERVATDDSITAHVLAENQEGAAFFERFDLEPVEDNQIEIGGQRLVERVFADTTKTGHEPGEANGGASSDESTRAGDATDDRDADIPDTLSVDGHERSIDREDPESGTLGPLFPVFEDPALEELYGFYCGNCGTFTAEVDEQGRVRCGECGNVHRPDDWDDAYL